MTKAARTSRWARIPTAFYRGGTGTILFLGASYYFLTYYASRFDYAAGVPAAGLCIILLAVGWLLVAAFAAKTMLPNIALFPAVLLSFGLLLFAMIVIYAAAFSSNVLWGDTINYETMSSFAIHSSAIKDAIGAAYASGKTSFALGLGLFMLVIAIGSGVAWLAAIFLTGLVDRAASRFSRSRRVIAVSAVISMAVGQAALLSAVSSSPERYYGEPALTFFKVVNASHMFKRDNRKIVDALEDRDVRASYAALKPTRPKNVVVIFSDSVRADHTSVYGYQRDTTPFLKRMYDSGELQRVEMALSTCSESYCGIASTLASRPFDEISPENFKLPDLLRDVGYKTNFYLSGDHRAWSYLYEFYGKQIDNFNDYISLDADSLDDRPLIRALEGIQRYAGVPNFFYVFLMSSHQAGKKLPEYLRYKPSADGASLSFKKIFAARKANPEQPEKFIGDDEFQAYVNRYDNGILQADAYIEKIFSILKDKGYLDDGIVVVMADHGEGLGEHGHFGHTRFLFQEDIRIPLLIYDSGKTPKKDIRFGTMMDVAPTIIDQIGLPVPSTWKGRPLSGAGASSSTIHQTHNGKELCFAVVDSSPQTMTKYMRCMNATPQADEFLFDLQKDPDEKINLMRDHDDATVASYRRRLANRIGFVRDTCDETGCASSPFIIAMGVTPSNDGVVHLAGVNAMGFFAVSTSNVGTSGQLTARIRLSHASPRLTATICETHSDTGLCKAPPSATVTRKFRQNESGTWSAFLTSSGAPEPDEGDARAIFEFADESGEIRGAAPIIVSTGK